MQELRGVHGGEQRQRHGEDHRVEGALQGAEYQRHHGQFGLEIVRGAGGLPREGRLLAAFIPHPAEQGRPTRLRVRIAQLVDVQVATRVECDNAVVFAAQPRQVRLVRQVDFSPGAGRGAETQAQPRGRADQEGFVANAWGVERRRAGERRQRLGLTKKAGVAVRRHEQAEDAILALGVGEYDGHATKKEFHGSDAGLLKVLKRVEDLSENNLRYVLASLEIEIENLPGSRRHHDAIRRLRCHADPLRHARQQRRQVVGRLENGFTAAQQRLLLFQQRDVNLRGAVHVLQRGDELLRPRIPVSHLGNRRPRLPQRQKRPGLGPCHDGAGIGVVHRLVVHVDEGKFPLRGGKYDPLGLLIVSIGGEGPLFLKGGIDLKGASFAHEVDEGKHAVFGHEHRQRRPLVNAQHLGVRYTGRHRAQRPDARTLEQRHDLQQDEYENAKDGNNDPKAADGNEPRHTPIDQQGRSCRPELLPRPYPGIHRRHGHRTHSSWQERQAGNRLPLPSVSIR